MQLLLGLHDPDSGAIHADGRDIREMSKVEWARKVTFVPQAAHLIAGTIADNIRFFRDDVADPDQAKPRGWPTSTTTSRVPRGVRAQGRRTRRTAQWWSAAAAVHRPGAGHNPDVLILDEPTSALDVRSEQLMRTTMVELKARKTVIVIAHRLSTLDICDRIMVIQAGELRGFDTPDNLARTNDFYNEALVLSGLR